MEDRKQKAIQNHKKGYNCGQAVACAYCDLVGVEEETAFKMTEGLGLGMGCMEGTCGAITGAITILGFKNSTANLDAPNSKGKTYQLSKKLVETFMNKNKAIVCKDLKGIETNQVLRSCQGCIEDASDILDDILNKME